MKNRLAIDLAFSPCPNDTFMMYALVHGKVPLPEGVSFDVYLHDVQELNDEAHQQRYAITKLSCRTMIDVADAYSMLRSGAAMGRGNGPLLVAKPGYKIEDLAQGAIAIPGLDTTAASLMRFAYPGDRHYRPMLFSDIEGAILRDEVSAGVLIHETRFMYAERGLSLVADLGEAWEVRTGQPIPLGCIAVRDDIDASLALVIQRALQESIRYAWSHYDEVLPYMKSHAQELSDDVIRKHVDLFVNDMSLDIGAEGMQAMTTLCGVLYPGAQRCRQLRYVGS